MKLKLGRAVGIDVFVHWTFFFAPLYVAWDARSANHSWAMVGTSLTVLLAMFACILLHEYGHALMARWYGIRTKDILLTPLGGLARLERMPRLPAQEFMITAAGPAVNLFIACGIFIVLYLAKQPMWPTGPMLGSQGFPQIIMLLNVALLLLNLIPAYPLDGGRILRSTLALFLDYDVATKVAGLLGQILGTAFVIVGLYFGEFFLALIGLFVILAAGAEMARLKRFGAMPPTAQSAPPTLSESRLLESQTQRDAD